MLGSPLALLCAVTAAAAPAAPLKLDLTTLLETARHQPRVEIARATAAEAAAKADEVSLLWAPQVEITLVGGPSQRIQCFDENGAPSTEHCVTTDPSETRLGFEGAFFRVDGNLKMPLFTFGKISAGRRAAEAGAQATLALAEGSEQDAQVDAAKAYFAVKLGRELQGMLGEGLDYIKDELAREKELMDKGSGDVTEADHRRVLTMRAEIMARISEAKKVEELGLAGVHYVAGAGGLDVDDKPLLAVDFRLPEKAEARALALARPEERAAWSGELAAEGLEDLAWAGWWPDFVLVASGTFARSSAVQHPENAFLNDPYNATSGVVGIALHWQPDLFTRMPKIAQARAARAKAQATLDMAKEGLPAEAERAWAEARDARDRIAAAREGVKHSKAWLAAVLQSEAAGLAEPKDLADALLQYFMQRGRLLQATFDWDVGVVALLRATGRPPATLRYAEED